MAVPKHRRTPRTRGNRRAHDKLGFSTLSVDAETGETHLRHHMTPQGFYKGRQVIVSAPANEALETDSE